jgi:hypothetical protein
MGKLLQCDHLEDQGGNGRTVLKIYIKQIDTENVKVNALSQDLTDYGRLF